MPWHDETPWAAKRRREEQQKASVTRTLEVIEYFGRLAKTGQISERKALEQIEQAVTNGIDSIVRVGTLHTPEIQTGREDQ
jgi:hypothetical protein